MDETALVNRGRVVLFLTSSLRSATKDRYATAVEEFKAELGARGVLLQGLSDETLDWALGEKVVALFEEGGETSLGLARGCTLVAACTRLRPHFRFRVAF